MHTSHLVNAHRKMARKDARVRYMKSCRNGSRSGVYVHFHFDASPAFHPSCWSCEPFGEFVDGIRGGYIKRSDDGVSFGRERAKTEEGLRVCGKRPVVSKAMSDNYLPQRHSILINSSAAFKATLPDLIWEYDPLNVCQRLHHKRKEKRRI